QGITTLHFVPSMLQVFLDSPGLDRCASLRRVIASGEALPADLERRFFARLGGSGAGLYNLYGPTEAAVDVTVWTCERHGRRASVPIGRPIANTRVHLLDRHLATTPLGMPGELHIGGVQVGRGYLNRPELTAERFIPDPFAGVPGARLYKTGDLARHLPDGAVEFLGRLDHQVKIRGFRIELGEIEATLAAHPGVREAVVVARERAAAGALGDWHLVAYVVGREGMELAPEAEELRGFLRSRLPAHMVPWAFVALPALPLNANGKIDRRALPDPERSAWGGAAGIEEPRSEMERTIAAIWRELLRLDPIGIDDNFFDSGGHSLLAVRVYHQLKRVAGREFPLVALFEHTTIRALARYLEAGEAAPASRLRGQDRGARRREAAAGRRRPRPGAIDSGAIEHDHSQELDSP
ncbi:MAG TPA: AMP-binding protein, partial [Thermoanaerobaculia bacterium]|nr:AMP-binding protein [Thermoanaerobaculia bacterium]